MTQEILEKLVNVRISTSQIQKVTNNIGNEMINQEEDFIKNPLVKHDIKCAKKIDKMVVSMDGAMINAYDDWKEVKTGTIFEIEETEKGLESINKSYVSKIEDHLSFRKRIKAEANRRRYKEAKEIIVIGDGARWIWDLAETEFPFSVKILDWYHAKEHLHKIVKLLYPDDFKQSESLIKNLENILYDGNIEKLTNVINENKKLSDIFDRVKDLADLQTEIEYFTKNAQKMQYKYFEEKKISYWKRCY